MPKKYGKVSRFFRRLCPCLFPAVASTTAPSAFNSEASTSAPLASAEEPIDTSSAIVEAPSSGMVICDGKSSCSVDSSSEAEADLAGVDAPENDSSDAPLGSPQEPFIVASLASAEEPIDTSSAIVAAPSSSGMVVCDSNSSCSVDTSSEVDADLVAVDVPGIDSSDAPLGSPQELFVVSPAPVPAPSCEDHTEYGEQLQLQSEKWIILYPANIDKDRSRTCQRRIPKEKAVSAPTAKEMLDVLSTTGLQVFGEQINCQSRVRVCIKDPQGVMINSKFQGKNDLMMFCADQIPKLKTRTNPLLSPQQSPPRT